ncbi:MAG: TnpV protein [Acutalibacteraceae bacterium]
MAQMTYRQVGDYKIPNLTLPAEENVTLGKYGMMRKKFLMENRKVYFTSLVSRGILMRNLKETEMQAQEMLERLTEQMMKMQGVTEQMKETDQMKWVQLMNNIRCSAEETVLKELIYS